jgi:TolA-binding protein
MKILTVLAAVLLSGCTADQQQRFADGYFGEPGHTFREAMFGTGNTGHPSAGGSASADEQLDEIRQKNARIESALQTQQQQEQQAEFNQRPREQQAELNQRQWQQQQESNQNMERLRNGEPPLITVPSLITP